LGLPSNIEVFGFTIHVIPGWWTPIAISLGAIFIGHLFARWFGDPNVKPPTYERLISKPNCADGIPSDPGNRPSDQDT
jgi:hypothetical protein